MPKYQIAINVTVDVENRSQAEKHSEQIKNVLDDWNINSITVSNIDKVAVDRKENGFYIGLAFTDR